MNAQTPLRRNDITVGIVLSKTARCRWEDFQKEATLEDAVFNGRLADELEMFIWPDSEEIIIFDKVAIILKEDEAKGLYVAVTVLPTYGSEYAKGRNDAPHLLAEYKRKQAEAEQGKRNMQGSAAFVEGLIGRQPE